MADLIAFTRRADLPVLAHTAIAHAQFETIHPFPDGNGRTGRALVHAMLRHGGVLRNVAVPVSAGLLTELDDYFDALTEYRSGRVRPIIEVFAAASLRALGNASTLADDVARLQTDWEAALSGIRSDAVARRIVPLTIAYPVINAATALRLTGASGPAVANALAQLEERGVLVPGNSRRRGRIWVNQGVIDALERFALRTGKRVPA